MTDCPHLHLKLALLLVACFLLSGCAVKHHWRSSEVAYQNWAINMCEKTHTPAECDPNWKPCSAIEGCQ